jgi:uncharacterized protein YcnI
MTMSTAPRTARTLQRTTALATAALVSAFASVVVFASVASAHVEVKPPEVEGGDFAEVAFSVPNEIDDASTIKLVVDLPKDPPLASVETRAVPGWTATTKMRRLAKPIELEGAPVKKVVSQITWKATDGGIAPGQFEDFPVSLGVLPTSGKLTFTAVQTYSNGEVVHWDEIAPEGAEEPEHPAPELTVTAPADEGDETTAPPEPTTTPTSAPSTSDTSNAAESDDGDDDESSDWVPIALSVAALVVALAALGLTWRRGRS